MLEEQTDAVAELCIPGEDPSAERSFLEPVVAVALQQQAMQDAVSRLELVERQQPE